MSGKAAANPGGGMVLRFQRPATFPDLLKFTDSDDLKTLESIPTTNAKEEETPYLYFESEEIRDDEDEEEDENAELQPTQRKKDRRRYTFRPKQLLGLRTANRSLKLEGTVGNNDLADSEDISKYKAYKMKKSAEDFSYCLFQFVEDSAGNKEIHVVPAGQMYIMRKGASCADQLLNELEEKKNQETQKKAERSVKKYAGIVDKLVEAHVANNGDGAPISTVTAAATGLRGKKELDKDYLIRHLKDIAAGENKNSVAPKGYRRGGGGGDGDFGGDDLAPTVKLNDIGVDEDELQAEAAKGDFGGRFADDEEDHVDIIQLDNKNDIEAEIGASARREEEDMVESDGDIDEEEDEKLLQEKRNEKNPLKATGGILDEKTIFAAGLTGAATDGFKNAQTKLLNRQNDIVKIPGVMTLKALKAGIVESPRKRPRLDPTTVLDHELNDAGIRKCIVDHGGKISAKTLLQIFSPKIEALELQKENSGKRRFQDIVSRIANMVDDPILGKSYTLKG